jgi:tetratricopeptide (TPR) repeat protein
MMSPKTLSLDEAEDLWQKAVELFRSSKKGDNKKAIKLAQQLIEQGPNTPETLSRMKCFIADIYSQKLDKYDESIEYYREALSDDPNNSLAGSNLGFVYLMRKKDYEAAVEVLQETMNRGISSAFVRETTRDLLAEARQKLGG